MPNDLGPDLATEVAQSRARLVPSPVGKPNGFVLAVTDTDDFNWQQPSEKQVREGNGDPNGNVNAPKGTLYLERGVPALWINTDGLSAWDLVGGSGFPITLDDGTYTYEIAVDGTYLYIRSWANATPSDTSFLRFQPDTGNARLIAVQDLFAIGGRDASFVANRDAEVGADQDLTLHAVRDTVLSGESVSIQATGANVDINAFGNVFLNLPTADPGDPGALWNDAGTVKVSP